MVHQAKKRKAFLHLIFSLPSLPPTPRGAGLGLEVYPPYQFGTEEKSPSQTENSASSKIETVDKLSSNKSWVLI